MGVCDVKLQIFDHYCRKSVAEWTGE